MADESGDGITDVLHKLQPASLLTLGEAVAGAVDAYLLMHPDCRHLHLTPAEAWSALRRQPLHRYALALATEVVESLDKVAARRLLAALRDLYAERLLLLVALHGAESRNAGTREFAELLSLGLSAMGRWVTGRRVFRAYSFDLYDYKLTPDWLNSRHWAHPELFDKYWW